MALRVVLLQFHLQLVKGSSFLTRAFSWLLPQHSLMVTTKHIKAKPLFWNARVYRHLKSKCVSLQSKYCPWPPLLCLEEALVHPLEPGSWKISEPLPLGQTAKGRPFPVMCTEQKAFFFTTPCLVWPSAKGC